MCRRTATAARRCTTVAFTRVVANQTCWKNGRSRFKGRWSTAPRRCTSAAARPSRRWRWPDGPQSWLRLGVRRAESHAGSASPHRRCLRTGPRRRAATLAAQLTPCPGTMPPPSIWPSWSAPTCLTFGRHLLTWTRLWLLMMHFPAASGGSPSTMWCPPQPPWWAPAKHSPAVCSMAVRCWSPATAKRPGR